MKISRNAPLSKGMVASVGGSYIHIGWVCQDIQNLEPDHINLFPELAAITKKVDLEWNEVLLEFERRANEETEKLISNLKENIPTLTSIVSSVEENTPPPAPPQNQPSRPGLEADARNLFRFENDGEKVPAMKTKNSDKQVIATMVDQQEQEWNVKSNEEQGNSRPEVSFNEEDQGNCSPKLPSISEIEIKNENKDAGDAKMKEPGINETFSNSSLIHSTNGDGFGKVEPGDTKFPGLDKSFDNKP